jgi:DNA-binding MarR family transcriptional regulator
VISLDFDEGLATGLALAVTIYLALWWWARRTRFADAPEVVIGRSPGGTPDERVDPVPPAETSEVPSPLPPSADPSALASGPLPEASAPDEPARAPRVRPGAVGSGPPRPRDVTDAVRLSQRVILHVYALGTLPQGDVAPPGLCQAGIGEALGVTQGGLAAVLRRLEAAGVVTVERGHVRGRDRRLKIYRLSAQGLEIARDLRARTVHRPAPGRAQRPADAGRR